MIPDGVIFYFVEFDDLIERVSEQMGIPFDDARDQLLWNDEQAIATFTPGNEYNRKHLH